MNNKVKKCIAKALVAYCIISVTASCSEPPRSEWDRIEVDYGKPGAPVSLEYRVIGTPQAGVEFNIEIAVTSNTPAGSIEVNLNTEGAIELGSGNQFVFNLVDPDKTVIATLMSPSDTLGYLNVNVYEQDESGNPLIGRSFSIPIKIGSGDSGLKSKSAPLNIIEDGDELIIEMPAQTN